MNKISSDNPIKLSICIATRNRAEFLIETVDCIIKQALPSVEIVIVDGASGDGSEEKLKSTLPSNNQVKYFYETVNTGVDGDFDKAVSYASGEYCWLFSDDDLLEDSAVSNILQDIEKRPDFIVVNASIHSKKFTKLLKNSVISFNKDISYVDNGQQAFEDLAQYLSFIGAIVVKRDFWMQRERKRFHGTAFAHIGVLFQSPLPQFILFHARPEIKIRYGNSEWAPRGLKIWTSQWQKQIFMLDSISEELRYKISHTKKTDMLKIFTLYRALGLFKFTDYRIIIFKEPNLRLKLVLILLLVIPTKLLNLILTIVFLRSKNSLINIYRLTQSQGSTRISRWISKNKLNSSNIDKKND